MTKAPTPAELSKGQNDNINNVTKKFDYTAVADRLRTVSWSNYCHPTPTDRPKSVRNRCVIELFVALLVLSLCPFDISAGVGAFVIGVSKICSFFSSSYFEAFFLNNPFFQNAHDSFSVEL